LRQPANLRMLSKSLTGDSEMEAVWGAVLSFLFVLATLSGYGTGLPQVDKDKSEKSDKKDENKKDEKSEDSSSKDKSDKKGKAGQKDKDNGSSGKASKKKAEYCIKDCPEAWRMRP
jgi:hypothetical protein